jgi:hypothetical protein
VFADTAAALDPDGEAFRAKQFSAPFTGPGELEAAWTRHGLVEVEQTALTIRMEFAFFTDYWEPWLGGQGTVGAYVIGLSEAKRRLLEHHLRLAFLAGGADGPRSFAAAAWAVRGVKARGGRVKLTTMSAHPAIHSADHAASSAASRHAKHVEDFALAVDRPPQVHGPAGDLDEHLVQMPPTARRTTTAPQPPGDQWAEAPDPDPDGLVGDDDAALGQQLLNVARAEGEAQVEPDRMLDDGLREAEAAVRCRLHAARLAPYLASSKPELTSPPGNPARFKSCCVGEVCASFTIRSDAAADSR